MTPTEMPIGARVASWRRRRKLSQQVFADRLGKSKSWVDKVERGVRRLDKFSVLQEIADVLQIDAQLLLGKAPERRSGSQAGSDDVERAEIRAALERYDSISMFFCNPAYPPALSELERSVVYAWLTYQHARYGTLTRSLPKLIRDAQAADSVAPGGDDAGLAAGLLSQVYQLTSSVLLKLGESEHAWLAADRAMTAAQRCGDLLLAGVATGRAGDALLALGRPRPALELTINIANRLAPGMGNGVRPEQLSVYGTLLLHAAMAAARMGDNSTVRNLIGEASAAARQLGSDQNHYWTGFGLTSVHLYSAAAAIELGEGREAVTTYLNIPEASLDALPIERRAAHLVDLARAFAQLGDLERAGTTLVKAEQLAPAETRYRPDTREVMTTVLRRTRGEPPAPVVELAQRMGLAG